MYDARPVTIGISRRARKPALAALARRMLDDVDVLVERMGTAYRAEIPEYAALSSGELATQVLPISRQAVTAFFSALARGSSGPSDFRVFEDSGRVRLTMGVPLDSVMHAYRIAGRMTWEAVVASIEPGEEVLLGDLGAAWIGFIDNASCQVARGYLAASHEQMRHVDARRRELLEALLSALGPADVAAVALRFSTVLAPAYVPVVAAGDGVAGRIDALLDAAPRGTIGGHRGTRVLLLVPDGAFDVAAMHRLVGGLTTYADAAPPGEGLVATVQHAEQLADVASASGDGCGVFGPDDLLVEQLMLAAPRVTEALRRRVADPLAARDPGGMLVETLRAYLSSGSVPETARAMTVHANTVGYRLARVRDLTGLDARIPREAAVLLLALPLDSPTESGNRVG